MLNKLQVLYLFCRRQTLAQIVYIIASYKYSLLPQQLRIGVSAKLVRGKTTIIYQLHIARNTERYSY